MQLPGEGFAAGLSITIGAARTIVAKASAGMVWWLPKGGIYRGITDGVPPIFSFQRDSNARYTTTPLSEKWVPRPRCPASRIVEGAQGPKDLRQD